MAGIYIPYMQMPNKKNGAVIIIYPQGVVMGEDRNFYQAITVSDTISDYIQRWEDEKHEDTMP